MKGMKSLVETSTFHKRVFPTCYHVQVPKGPWRDELTGRLWEHHVIEVQMGTRIMSETRKVLWEQNEHSKANGIWIPWPIPAVESKVT